AGVPDLGHRLQLLGIGPSYQPLNQVGIGIVQNGTGQDVNYYTIDSADSRDRRPILTGVVYNDVNHNGQYDAGDGGGGAATTVYQTYLKRSPDAAGLGFWTIQLQQGMADETLEAIILNSAEYIANHGSTQSGWVTGLYQDVLGRTPLDSEVSNWVSQLQNGLT